MALLSVIGAVAILLATERFGAGLTTDSVNYIATARNIAAGAGVVTYDGRPLVLQPPLYPAVLATVDYVFGVDPLLSAHIVNAVLFGLIVYLSGLLFLKFLRRSVVLAFLGAVATLVSFPLIHVSLMAWSEPLFICFVLLYLLFAESYWVRPSLTSLGLASLSVGAACLTRYIGVIFIASGVIAILLSRTDSRRRRIRDLLFFACISALPLGLWIIRNYLLSGTLFGPRASSVFTLSENIVSTAKTILFWYVPREFLDGLIPESLRGMRGIVSAFLLTIVCVAGLAAVRYWPMARAFCSDRGCILLPIIAYLGFLVASSTTTAYDKIDSRLLSPLYVPITLVLFLIASRMAAAVGKLGFPEKGGVIMIGVIIAAWLVYPSKLAMSLMETATTQGQGYSGEYWRNSEIIRYVAQNRALRDGRVIYTNDPYALYILAGAIAKMSPRRTMYNSPDVVNDLAALEGCWPEEGNAWLVWIDKYRRQYLFTVDELRTIADVRPVISLEDGAVYVVARR